jgi:hypothetical protein
VLHPGTPGHHRILITIRLMGQRVEQLLQQGVRFRQRAAQLQDQPVSMASWLVAPQ